MHNNKSDTKQKRDENYLHKMSSEVCCSLQHRYSRSKRIRGNFGTHRFFLYVKNTEKQKARSQQKSDTLILLVTEMTY